MQNVGHRELQFQFFHVFGKYLVFWQALVCKSAESKNSIEIEIIILKREQEAASLLLTRGEREKSKPGGLDLSRHGLDRDSRSRHF